MLGSENLSLLLTAVGCAFLGVFIASRLLKKVTMKGIQILISVLLFAISIGLIFGFI
jgi:hypothetical protein